MFPRIRIRSRQQLFVCHLKDSTHRLIRRHDLPVDVQDHDHARNGI